MIGLDTHVLVSYRVQDDPTQTRQANALVDRAAAQETAMFINPGGCRIEAVINIPV